MIFRSCDYDSYELNLISHHLKKSENEFNFRFEDVTKEEPILQLLQKYA